MPCENHHEDYTKQELDKVTSMLCLVLNLVYHSKDLNALRHKIKENTELYSWWEQHLEADKNRVMDIFNKTFTESERILLSRLIIEANGF